MEKTLARAQKAELRCDDLETQLKQTLEREAQMKSTLDKERETAFAIMSDFQERVIIYIFNIIKGLSFVSNKEREKERDKMALEFNDF